MPYNRDNKPILGRIRLALDTASVAIAWQVVPWLVAKAKIGELNLIDTIWLTDTI
jgi:hypothetical protein